MHGKASVQREPFMPFDDWISLGPQKAAEYLAQRGGYTAQQQAKLLAIFQMCSNAKTCPDCKGIGTVPVTVMDVTADFECPKCDGRSAKKMKTMKTKTPAGITPLEFAMFNLLHAVEELSRQNKKVSDPAL
jgi:hypothetical protein